MDQSMLKLTFLLVFLALLILVALAFYLLFFPPSNLPRNIPTIPFYYALLPLFKDVDQEELYRNYLAEPLRRHGAVKIYFGGRWNILVQRPSFLTEVFRHEDIYAKSGNQKKIPHSVLAEYTGDNIISSHGDNWRLYTSVIKPGLQQDLPAEPITMNARLLVKSILEEQMCSREQSVMVGNLLQRWALANLSESLLEASFETLQKPDAPLHKLQLQIKPHIFHPFFLNFPFLDLFKLRSRQRARELVREFHDILTASVRSGHKHTDNAASAQSLKCRMIKAVEDGLWTEKQFRHNMVAIFLAGHENPQLLMTSTLFLMAENKDIQQRLREEIMSLGSTKPAYTTLQNLTVLTSVIYESLRLYPPISQLINRCTTQDVVLGDEIIIPAGTYVGYNCYSTNRDRDFWGPDADEFKPERWGSTMQEINSMFRRANSKATFVSFHGGRRACLGQKFAMFTARITLAELVRRLEWDVDPTWPRRITPAGPLYPRMLRLQFHPIEVGKP